MRFKSEKGFSRLSVRRVLSAAALSCVLGGSAFAQTPSPTPTATAVPTTFLIPPAPYVWERELGSVYIARLTSASHGINTAQSYRSWEISTTSAAAGSDLTEMFYFDVRIDDAIAASAGNRLVLVIETDVLSGTPTHKFVPIASVGVDGAPCASSTSCLYTYRSPAVSQVDGTASLGGLAAEFGNGPKTLRVGFFFGDICAQLGVGGVRPNGCDETTATSVVTPVAGTPAQFTLNFRIKQVPSGALVGTSESAALTAATTVKELKAVITVQADGPTVACTLEDIYFPGDTVIQVDTSKVVGARATSGAPIHKVVVTAEELAGNPSGTVPPSTDDDVIAYIAPTGVNPAGPFVNTTDGSDHQYAVQFNVMDEAGVMPLPLVGATSCLLGTGGIGVQTSEIQSFLGSSACFIATASFQSEHHPEVEELRKFRDQVLAHSRLGRRFIALYYDLSPRAASIVDAHPALRLPALFLLAPIEFMAALLLRPIFGLAWLMGWSGLGGLLYVRSRRWAR